MPDDDILDDLLDADPEDDMEEEESAEDINSIKAELENLKKEKYGLLQDVKSERRKRQEFQSYKEELDTLKGTVAAILEQNAQRTSPDSDESLKGMPVEYTDDGEAYVKPDKVVDIFKSQLESQQNEIESLKAQLQASMAQATQSQENNAVINSLLGEDERFDRAYKKYQSARKWANDRVIEFQQERNITGYIRPTEALDHVFSNKMLEDEFKKEFPGIAIEDVILAGESPRLMKRALSNIAGILEDKTTEPVPNSKFQKVLNKPSGLGKKANAKAGSSDLLGQLGESFSSLDVLSLSDAQVQALEKALLDEEKSDGVKF